MRALLAALLICVCAFPTLAALNRHAKPPKAVLVQTYIMPGETPDLRKKAVPKNSEDECWEDAKAFTHKGVPEDLKGIAVGVMGACLIPDQPDQADDPDDSM